MALRSTAFLRAPFAPRALFALAALAALPRCGTATATPASPLRSIPDELAPKPGSLASTRAAPDVRAQRGAQSGGVSPVTPIAAPPGTPPNSNRPPGPTNRPPPPPPPPPGDFCSRPENQLRQTPWPANPGNRMARVALDAHCSRHPAVRCTSSSPVNPVSQPPTECVDLEVLQGAPPAAVPGEEGHPAMCASCPGELLPTAGLPACDAGTLAQARRGRVLFNLSGATVAHLDALYAQLVAARAARIAHAPAAIQRDPDQLRTYLSQQSDWSVQIEQMIRELAPQIGYCEAAPFGQLETNRGWRYAERGHRVDLDSDISFRGEGQFGSTTLGTSTYSFGTTGVHSFLQVYLTAFYASPQGGRPADPTRFDLHGLVMALLHEMRHMGSPGLGQPAGENLTVSNAERFLNELEDYSRMFDHPYLIGLDPAVVQRLRAEFGAGRNTMYGCFAHTWSAQGPMNFPGYPDDSQQAVGMALGMGMPGFGGLMMPVMGLGGRAPGVGGMAGPIRPVWPHVLADVNWNPAGWNATQCTSSGLPVTRTPSTAPHARGRPAPPDVVTIVPLTSPGQRCEVARWAAGDVWMRSKMVRSIAPDEEHQPWNTLAHWVLALPFRGSVYPPCVQASPGG